VPRGWDEWLCLALFAWVSVALVRIPAVSALSGSLLVPNSVEIRLVGLREFLSAEALQQSLDALSTTDVQLYPGIQLGLSYKVRMYDTRINAESDLVQSKSGDDLARADEMDQKIFERHEPSQSFVFYVLYSKVKRRAYATDPTRSGDDECCATQVWSSEKARFAWIDFAAVDPPSEYGPLLDGEGYVSFGRAIPKPEDMSRPSFLSKLAALCHRATLHLAAPSPSRIKPFVNPFERSTVRIFVMVASSSHPLKDREAGSIRARWETKVLSPLRQVAKILNPNLTFEVVMVEMATCPVCAAAHELAIENGERTEVLNPKKLREVLLAKFGSPATSNLLARMFNVFVYRSDTGPLLLVEGGKDRQVAVFEDSIVAVEGSSSEVTVPSAFQCGGQASALTLDTSDVTRQVLAGALQALFGVTPTAERYSAALERSTHDYLFEVGHTPFGPLSRSVALSSAIVAASVRNPILAHLAETVALHRQVHFNLSGMNNLPNMPEVLQLLRESESLARRSAGFLGLVDIEHAKEFALGTRRPLERAMEILGKVEVITECFPESGEGEASHDDEHHDSNLLGLSLIPLLLLFTLGAVMYETRMTVLTQTFVPEGSSSSSRRQHRTGSRKEFKAFAAPAKKVD